MRAWLGTLRQPAKLAVLLAAFLPIAWAYRFIQIYQVNLAHYDTLIRSTPLAVAVQRGTVTLADFFTPYVGHISVPNYLMVALLTLTTGWDTSLEAWVVLTEAVICYGALLALLHRTDERVLWVGAVPVSALFFAIRQELNWLITFSGVAWFAVHLCLLWALWLAFRREQRAWQPVAALALAGAATFSHGQGFLVLWLVLAGLWAAGYRRAWALALGGVYAAALTAAYFILAGVALAGDADTSSVTSAIALSDAVNVVPFTLVYLGNLFFDVAGRALWFGAAGVLLAAYNAVTLWRQDWRAVVMWLLVMAYSTGTGAMVGLTRQDVYTGAYAAALQTQYLNGAALFWVALVALAAWGAVVGWERRGARLWVNAGAAVVGGIVYGVGAISITPFADFRYINEPCHYRYIYWQDPFRSLREDNCILIDQPDMINVLAYYRLNMFAETPPRHILPEVYSPDDPVVVLTNTGWEHFHVRRWLLNDVPDDTIIPVYTEAPKDFPAYDIALEHRNHTPPGEAPPLLANADTFWLVAVSGRDVGNLPDTLLADYVPVAFSYRTPERVNFDVIRYQRFDLASAEPIRFGDAARMIGYTSLSDRLAACTTVTVRSFWEAVELPLADGYSATLTLDRVTGGGPWDYENIARADSGLTYTPTQDWTADGLYVDERTLMIPCDLPPGEYALQLGVYNYRDGRRLPPYIDEQPPAPEQDIARLETVTVE